MILFGLYSGQRLGDIATLRWNNIDLAHGKLRFSTRKTGKTMILPLAEPLRKYIESLSTPQALRLLLFTLKLLICSNAIMGTISRRRYSVSSISALHTGLAGRPGRRHFPCTPARLTGRRLVLALRLQHRGQPGCPCAGGRDFGSNPVTQPHAVKTVTVMSNVLDGLQVHYGMPADLDKRVAT